MNPKNVVRRFIILSFPLIFIFGFMWMMTDTGVRNLVFSDLVKEVVQGNIKKVVIFNDGVVEGEFRIPKDGKPRFTSSIGEGDSAFLSRKLESQNPIPEIIKAKAPPSLLETLFIWLPIIFMVGLGFFILRKINPAKTNSSGIGGIGGLGNFTKPRIKGRDTRSKPITFKDVAGVDEAKEELVEIVDFLGNPQKYTKLGGRIPKGVLLVGPPGVGKTLLAKAVAGEANVPFFSMAGSEFIEMYVGVGASRVRELFDLARANPPCIIFIDEIDALGKRGSSNLAGHNESGQTLNQILVELDGFENTGGIIVIAATNREDKLDEALLRPGRFDRKVYIHLPDIRGREEILNIHARNLPLDPDVNMKTIARMTPGYSGAGLANMVNEAALNAAKEDKETVSMKDFEFAREKILMGREDKSLSSVMTEEEKKVTAVHEAGHALVAVMMPGNDPLYKVSIIPRGGSLGQTSQLPEKDRYNVSEEFLMENLSILYGGRVAEKKVFGKITAGAQNDIERATELARTMVCELGMSELGAINFDKKDDSPWSNQSEKTQREIDLEVRRILNETYQNAETVINEHEARLRKIADALMEKETLGREEIEALVKEP
ncbi:MAG: ATP-dependent zinc metalloprotease FtsH [Candidatus Yanofskybacteria bacterium]|nr:ATP-dependent zinc metalloprotease FtsH [Candidatus Yanofskybacteria bacterium]